MLREEANLYSPLSTLRHGARAVVVDVDMRQPQLVAKLAARGVVPGVSLEVLRGGDPLLLLLDDSRWALTSEDAAHILVRPTHLPLRSRLRALLFAS